MIACPKIEMPALNITRASTPSQNQDSCLDLAIIASPVNDNPNPINIKPETANSNHLNFNFFVSSISKNRLNFLSFLQLSKCFFLKSKCLKPEFVSRQTNALQPSDYF